MSGKRSGDGAERRTDGHVAANPANQENDRRGPFAGVKTQMERTLRQRLARERTIFRMRVETAQIEGFGNRIDEFFYPAVEWAFVHAAIIS